MDAVANNPGNGHAASRRGVDTAGIAAGLSDTVTRAKPLTAGGAADEVMAGTDPNCLAGSGETAYFDAMFANDDDPWQFRHRWYERRKRALTLAMLPKERYVHGFEPGCANGELAAALASRCDRLSVSDAAPRAVELATQRLAACSGVRVARRMIPDDWPDDRFDLIVISELAYYLTPEALVQLAECIETSLLPGGTFVACHWRHPIEGWRGRGDDVHAAFGVRRRLHRISHYEDADLLLDVWSNDAQSIAQTEGLC